MQKQAKGFKPGTGPTKPGTGPAKPGTGPAKPGAGPTKPRQPKPTWPKK
jgi:hypothetical protein